MHPVEAADLALPTQTGGNPKPAYEEFAVASWEVIPRAAQGMRGGSLLPNEESIYTEVFGFDLAQRVQIQAANSKPAALSRRRGQRKYSPLRRWVGVLATDRQVPMPAPRLQAQGDKKKPCELLGKGGGARGRGARGLSDPLSPGFLTNTALRRTLLKNAGNHGGRWMAFLESNGVCETEQKQKEASDLVYSVRLCVSERG